MKRSIGLQLLLVFFLALFAGFVYFGHNPDSPWLERAEEWPLVGDLARRFREAYLGSGARPEEAPVEEETEPLTTFVSPPPPSAPRPKRPETKAPAAEPPPVATSATEPRSPLLVPPSESGQESSESAGGARPPPPRIVVGTAVPRRRIPYIPAGWTWFLPGNRILASPDPEAEVVVRLEAMAYLPILEQEGQWAKVMRNDRPGWIDTSWAPPYNRRKARRGILRHRTEPVRGNDPFRLKEARKILGIERPTVKLGAYTLHTDVEDEEMLAFLDSAATAAEESYFARYGRLPSGDPQRAAVLFASYADYSRFAERANLASSSHAGFAGGGILTLYVEGRSRESLARTLVHEITHLLNDRSLAYALPPWLEEGLASDHGAVWVEDSPSVASEAQGRWTLTTQGMESRLFLLEKLLQDGKLPGLGGLLALDRETFHQPGVESYAYAHSAALIRYLVDGEDGRLGDGFREFLKNIAIGFRADLLKQLDVEGEVLEEGFRAWVQVEAEKGRKRLESRARDSFRPGG